MDFSEIDLDPQHTQLLTEVRDFIAQQFTDEVYEQEHRTGDAFNEAIHLAMGEKGWLFPSWPVERGGAGLDRLGARIIELEMRRSRLPMVTLGTTRLVAKAIEKFSDPTIRDELLLGAARGTARFCLGYTEPDGGSDIAGAKTKAFRDGDNWVISGSKMFTTGAHQTQYTFLIARTDPTLPKHKGLTMFLVPLDSPGVEIQGLWAFSGERTNIVYYDDVVVPDKYRLGAENGGWAVLHGPLDEEHSIGRDQGDGLDDLSMGVNFLRELHYAIDDVAHWAATDDADGRNRQEDPALLERLGRIVARTEAGMVTPGPAGRIAGSDVLVEGASELLDLLGFEGLLSRGVDGAIGNGHVEYAHRFAQGTATYAGSVEVFRTIIAQHSLGLPRPQYAGSREFGVSPTAQVK